MKLEAVIGILSRKISHLMSPMVVENVAIGLAMAAKLEEVLHSLRGR